jgi:hypothetical protein
VISVSLTEHEEEFIDHLIDEFGAWGWDIEPWGKGTIKEIVIDSYDENWKQFTYNLKIHFHERGFDDFNLRKPEIEEIFENAEGFSEFRLSKWVQ